MILEKKGAVNFQLKLPGIIMKALESQAEEEKRSTGDIVRACLQLVLWDRIVAMDPAQESEPFRVRHIESLGESALWLEDRALAFRSRIVALEALDADTEA